MSLSNAGMQGLKPGVVTSTTRPTNPYTGQIIYETDTGYLRVWDGANWDHFSPKQDTIPGGWQAYTPTWRGSTTNPAIGNGTIRARYSIINKTAVLQCFIGMGSTTTYGSGRYDVTVPSGVLVSGTAYQDVLGSAFFYDNSATSAVPGVVVRGPTNDVVTFRITGSAFGDVTPTAPFTFANSDQISFIATYEIV